MKEHIFLSGISIEEFEADLLEKLKALIQPALLAIQREEVEEFTTHLWLTATSRVAAVLDVQDKRNRLLDDA